MKIGSMNNSSEIHCLANSIAGPVAAITETINAKAKEANETRASADAVLPQQTSHLTAIERWDGKKRSDRLASAEFLAKGPPLSPGYC